MVGLSSSTDLDFESDSTCSLLNAYDSVLEVGRYVVSNSLKS